MSSISDVSSIQSELELDGRYLACHIVSYSTLLVFLHECTLTKVYGSTLELMYRYWHRLLHGLRYVNVVVQRLLTVFVSIIVVMP